MSNPARPTANAYAQESGSDTVSPAAAPDRYVCPVCGRAGLSRLRRRPIDHVLSLFIRQRRFRCTQPGCQWQGNLREKIARAKS